MTPLSSPPPAVTPRLLLAAAALLLAACGGGAGDTPSADSASVVLTPTAPSKIGEVTGLATPEGALYDVARDVWYISNINGNPNELDNNGYITKVSGDFAMVDTMFIAGGSAGTTLNAPKGMALVGDTLWVADINAVRGFDVVSGFEVASINVDGAVFLNDIAASLDGTLYISDTGIAFGAGGMTHPGPDRIFKLSGRTVTEALRFEGQPGPNGLLFGADGKLIILPFAASTISAWTAGAASADSLASGPGGFDGAVLLADGRVLVSSWTDSTVHALQNGTLTPFIRGVPAPADMGVNQGRNQIAIPLFESGRVEFWSTGTN